MRSTAFALVALMFILPLTPVHASTTVYSADGTFRVGLGAVAQADACIDDTFQGVTGNCVVMRSAAIGHDYGIIADATSPTLLGLTACFYKADKTTLIACQALDPQVQAKAQADSKKLTSLNQLVGTVPAQAGWMSVSAVAGVSIVWHFATLN